jgi:hypothetical protein
MYNVEHFVEQAVRSVLSQQGISHQLIIVNDGSTDGGLARVLALLAEAGAAHVIVISQENRGLSAARNIGLLFALGTYIAFLDTDDFMAANAYAEPLRFAREHKLDAVLFRSLIYDEAQGIFCGFYDWRIWDRLLKGEKKFITGAAECPELLRLEPNANTRIVRREFVFAQDLFYPEGLVFEDQPVHVALVLAARRVGLLDSALYHYRINRPGKITDQRSRRRFDILRSFDIAVRTAEQQHASAAQGAQLLAALLRITYWCGTMVALGDRMEFFTELGRRFAALPAPWTRRYKALYRQDLKSQIALWALQRQKTQFLYRMSVGRKDYGTLALFFVSERRFGALAYQVGQALKRHLSPASSRYKIPVVGSEPRALSERLQ